MAPLRPLTFGEILDGAFTLYRRDFGTFFTTSLLASIPLALASRMIEAAALSGDAATVDPSALAAMLVAGASSALIWALVWGALTRQTARRVHEEETSLRDGYGRSLRVLPRMVAAGVLILLASLVLLVLLAVGIGVIAAALAILNAGGAVAGLAFTGLFLVGVLVMLAAWTSFFAVVPAMVVEDLGVWASLSRSHRLARGARLRIVAMSVVSSLIAVLPLVGLAFLVGIGGAAWDVESAATLSTGQVALQQLITIVSAALTTPFMVACYTLLYFDRRVRTEGYDLDLVADALAPPSEPALS